MFPICSIWNLLDSGTVSGLTSACLTVIESPPRTSFFNDKDTGVLFHFLVVFGASNMSFDDGATPFHCWLTHVIGKQHYFKCWIAKKFCVCAINVFDEHTKAAVWILWWGLCTEIHEQRQQCSRVVSKDYPNRWTWIDSTKKCSAIWVDWNMTFFNRYLQKLRLRHWVIIALFNSWQQRRS